MQMDCRKWLRFYLDFCMKMIYTHTVKSRTQKERKSPLDFNSGKSKDGLPDKDVTAL